MMPLAPDPPGWRAPDDWDEWVQLRLPDPLAQGDGLPVFQILHKPFSDVDDRVREMARHLISPSEASGGWLDLWGSHLSEPRGGLNEDEYRRLLGARLASQKQSVGVDEVLHVLELLVSPLEVRTYKLGSATTVIEAQIDWTPSEGYQRRAGRVLRDTIEAAGHLSVHLYRDSFAEWDSGVFGWEDPWAIDLFVMTPLNGA